MERRDPRHEVRLRHQANTLCRGRGAGGEQNADSGCQDARHDDGAAGHPGHSSARGTKRSIRSAVPFHTSMVAPSLCSLLARFARSAQDHQQPTVPPEPARLLKPSAEPGTSATWTAEIARRAPGMVTRPVRASTIAAEVHDAPQPHTTIVKWPAKFGPA